MLSKVSAEKWNVGQCLNTKEKVQLVRQLAEATSYFYYVELQRQLWQEYFDIGMKDNVWGKKISKSKAKQLATCRSFGYTKHVIQERQLTIAKQRQKATIERTKYTVQLENETEHWEPHVDTAVLVETINELVKNSQRRLRQEFDFKKNILMMNSNDHRLIKEFFNLQPTNDQVSTV